MLDLFFVMKAPTDATFNSAFVNTSHSPPSFRMVFQANILGTVELHHIVTDQQPLVNDHNHYPMKNITMITFIMNVSCILTCIIQIVAKYVVNSLVLEHQWRLLVQGRHGHVFWK